MTGTLHLSFRAPTTPLSENEARGQHWATVAERLGPWKTATWVSARNAIVKREWPPPRDGLAQSLALVPITVQVTIPFRKNRRRDAHNYTGTIVKAVVDGLVKAGVVPDDTPEWVTVLDSNLATIPTGALTALITIQQRNTP